MTTVFAAIGRGCRWLINHWYVPLTALSAVIAWLIFRPTQKPGKVVADELQAIRVRDEIRRLNIKKDADTANVMANIYYHDTIKAMDDEQKVAADRLRKDPVARVRYLRKLAKRLGE